MIGEIVSHYSIVETLGHGGMGVVYKAQDTQLGRFVALKFLSKKFRRDHRAMERFRQEARTASALNHPGICTIHAIDEYQGQPFIVMEFLEGRTLRQHLCNHRLTIEEAIVCGIQVAEALGIAHAKGIVHCDITPANLFITEEGRIKLLDFGIAQLMRANCTGESSTLGGKATRSALTGTVRYMSPEQALGRDVDARSDIFSVGVVLYEMLTGRLPFIGANFVDTINQVINAEAEIVRSINPNIPVAIESVVNKCLEKRPERRYPTAAELQKDLTQAIVVSRVVVEHSVALRPLARVPQPVDSAIEIQEQTSSSLTETLPDWTTRIVN